MPELTTEELVPEAAAYITAWDKAQTVYQDEYGQALKLPTATVEEDRARYAAMDAAREKCVETCRALWETLSTAEHPLIRWIYANARDNRAEATVIIRHLGPDTTITDLDEVARENDWCYVWNRYRVAAIQAGVINAPDHQIKQRVNGGPWGEFWVHEYRGQEITKNMINALFETGVSVIELNVGRDHVVYERVLDANSRREW